MIFKFLVHIFAVTNVALLSICAYSFYPDCSRLLISSFLPDLWR